MAQPSHVKPTRAESILALGMAAVALFLILTVWILAQWPRSLAQAFIFVLASAAVFLWAGRRLSVRQPLFLAACGLPALIGLLQLWLNVPVYRFATAHRTLDLFAVAAGALVMSAVSRTPVMRQRIRWTLAISGGVLAAEAILQALTAGERIFWIFPSPLPGNNMGPFLNRDHYCILMELLLPIAIWEAFRSSRQALFIAATGLMYASVVVSASRAGAAVGTLEIAAVLLMGLRNRRRALTAAAIVALSAALSFAVGWDVLAARMREPDPFAFRRQFVASSIQMFRARPLAGFGLGCWPVAYPSWATFDPGVFANHAHCDWAEWACEGGAGLFLIMLALAAWSARVAARTIWAAGVLAASAHALVDFPFQSFTLSLLVFGVFACASSVDSRE